MENQASVQPTVGGPHEREAQMFPRLDWETIGRLLPYGTVEAPPSGEILFRQGDRAVDFFVVLAGKVDLLDESAGGDGTVFRSYEAGQFTGELHLFNDRALLVTGRTAEGTRVLRLSRSAFRRMISTEADIGEMVMRAFILRRVGLIADGQGGVTVVGSARSSDVHRLRAFLERNAHPYRLLDLDTDPAAISAVSGFEVAEAELPMLILPGGGTMRNPDIATLASALGLDDAGQPDAVHDVAVIGAGPAGLAAAVYAASEGLDTIVIESEAPGGQAGTSSRIENYLGFPTGISGQALAGRAQVQAQKFGARLVVSLPVTRLDCAARPYALTLQGGTTIRAHAVARPPQKQDR